MGTEKTKQGDVQRELSLDEFVRLAELYKNFSDPTRLKILYELSHGELYVQEIATRLGMSQSAISHQLRILRNVRLVKFKKEGKGVRYALDDDHVEDILRIGAEHVNHSK
jgi:DNA-binding transcriptional ArsR family regulator